MLLTKRQFLTSVLALSVSAAARAAGGPSGPAVHFQSQGKIGEVFVNPYKIAPLTAVIGNGGYELRNASVRIVPKPNGQEITYSVADRLCRTHGGIPVFGLYPDYQNTVEVEYDRVANDTARTVEHIRESYKIYAGPAYIGSDGTDLQTGGWFRAGVRTPEEHELLERALRVELDKHAPAILRRPPKPALMIQGPVPMRAKAC